MTKTTIRLVLASTFIALSSASIALAAPGADKPMQAEGKKGKNKGAWFDRLDVNKDGFLTKAEVGERKWTRIVVADANKDNKVSKAELQQAKADGKLKKGKGKRKNKS